MAIHPHSSISLRHHLSICLLLIGLLLLPYYQVRDHEFVDLDDDTYIVENPYINEGLNVDGLLWAFSVQNKENYYWRPLTWVSHMLDFEFFGLNAGWHHITNVLLHLSNTLLLYALLFVMTGRTGGSAMVSALFALHPINVESVAWITERSNLLSTAIGLTTMLFYVRYTCQPSRSKYLFVLLSFFLCLLVKPILVTLPFLMLLLDYWPLRRLGFNSSPRHDSRTTVRTVVAEKIPLVLLSFLAISLSLLRLGSSDATAKVSIMLRLANAAVAYVKYLINLVYPINLAPFYPFPESIPAWKILGAVLILATITGVVLWQMTKRPYLFVGWFWFTGTMFPTCGLVQAGVWPELADRWAYFPTIGLFILVVWWAMEHSAWLSGKKRKITLASVVSVGVLMISVTWIQAGFWANSTLLFNRMLDKTEDNWLAHNNLGKTLVKKGQHEEARRHFLKAIEIHPGFEIPYFNLGKIAQDKGQVEESTEWFEKVITLKPNHYNAHIALGNAYFKLNNYPKAWRHFSEAIRLDPSGGALPFNGLGGILANTGQYKKASRMFQKALEVEPDYKPAKLNLERVETAMRTKSPG